MSTLSKAERAAVLRAAVGARMSYPFPHTWDRARYPVAWLCTRPSEATVQAQVLRLLAVLDVEAFPVDAGAKTLRGRAIGALKRRGASKGELAAVNFGKAGGAERGVCDVVGTLPGGRALYLEVKRPEWLEWHPHRGVATQLQQAGAPTDAQLQFLERMHTQGAIVGVVWSDDDAKRILTAAVPPRTS